MSDAQASPQPSTVLTMCATSLVHIVHRFVGRRRSGAGQFPVCIVALTGLGLPTDPSLGLEVGVALHFDRPMQKAGTGRRPRSRTKAYYRWYRARHKKQFAAAHRRWVRKNREKVRAIQRAYARRHPEEQQRRLKKWRREHPFRLREHGLNWYRGHRRECRRRQRDWYHQSRERALATSAAGAARNKSRMRSNRLRRYIERREHFREKARDRRARLRLTSVRYILTLRDAAKWAAFLASNPTVSKETRALIRVHLGRTVPYPRRQSGRRGRGGEAAIAETAARGAPGSVRGGRGTRRRRNTFERLGYFPVGGVLARRMGRGVRRDGDGEKAGPRARARARARADQRARRGRGRGRRA